MRRRFDLGELDRARGSKADWLMRERTSTKGVAGNGSPEWEVPNKGPTYRLIRNCLSARVGSMLVIPRDVNVKCDREAGSRQFSGLSARLADPAAWPTESLNPQSGPQ